MKLLIDISEINKYKSRELLPLECLHCKTTFRQTKNNICNLCQKNLEAFNRKMINCVIFFDITKALIKYGIMDYYLN